MSEPTKLLKPFGLWSAIFLVVANMIGAGVFTTSGFSFADLGDRQYVMLAWLIGGAIAICGAISYGQLAQRVTESGGEYLFLTRLVHPSVGFIAGWVSLLAGFTGAIAFAATAFESYAVPESIRPAWFFQGMAGITAIILFAILHSLVLKSGLIAQNLIVILKLVLLVGFIAVAFAKFPTGWEGMQIETAPADFSIYAIASTLVWISLSFSGFNAAVYVTGEVDNPKKNVPRALLIGTLIVTLFYLTLNFIFVFGAAPDMIKAVPDVAAVASQAIGGDRLATLIRIIVSLALLSSVSSMIVAGPRVYAKMASDGVFPKLFNSTNRNKLEIPATAIWLQAVLAALVVYFSTIKDQLDYLGFTLSVSAALTVACIFWSRQSNVSGANRNLYSAIALVYVVATIGLATLSAIGNPQQLTGFAITVASGLVIYYLVGKALLKLTINYFAIVFATGFALGIIRTLWLVPMLGIRSAELLEMPLMLAVIVIAAARVFRRSEKRFTSVEPIAVGGFALILMLIAEAGLVAAFQGISIPQYIANRDPVSGSAYLVALLLFGAMPWLVGTPQAKDFHQPD